MDLNLRFVGWCFDKEENHDKVWGVIEITRSKYLVFWGARGKRIKYQVKDISSWGVDDLISKKKRKSGYEAVDKAKLNDVYPTFEEDLQKTAFWGLLSA